MIICLFFILLSDWTLVGLTWSYSLWIVSIEWVAMGIKKEKLIVHREKSWAGQMWVERDLTWALNY